MILSGDKYCRDLCDLCLKPYALIMYYVLSHPQHYAFHMQGMLQDHPTVRNKGYLRAPCTKDSKLAHMDTLPLHLNDPRSKQNFDSMYTHKI